MVRSVTGGRLRLGKEQVNESHVLPLPERQTEIKNRPVPQLAGNAKAAAVGFHDGFADG